MKARIVKGPYNPGMNPFAAQPSIRFDADRKLGDAGGDYEFNVKLYNVACSATEREWSADVETARDEFEQVMRRRYPWLTGFHFTGRSAGWLVIRDPEGKMTMRRLLAIGKAVEKAVEQFKRDMMQCYPRKAASQ